MNRLIRRERRAVDRGGALPLSVGARALARARKKSFVKKRFSEKEKVTTFLDDSLQNFQPPSNHCEPVTEMLGKGFSRPKKRDSTGVVETPERLEKSQRTGGKRQATGSSSGGDGGAGPGRIARIRGKTVSKWYL